MNYQRHCKISFCTSMVKDEKKSMTGGWRSWTWKPRPEWVCRSWERCMRQEMRESPSSRGKCLMEGKAIKSRLMRMRMKGKHINITIVQWYARTNDTEEDRKDAFYYRFQAELENTPHHTTPHHDWWETWVQEWEVTTQIKIEPWERKDVVVWRTMERGYFNSAGQTIWSSEGHPSHTKKTTSLPGASLKPPDGQRDLEKITAGCRSQKRNWCWQWPPSCNGRGWSRGKTGLARQYNRRQ